MKIIYPLLFGCLMVFGVTTEASGQPKKSKSPEADTQSSIERLNVQTSELIASRISTAKVETDALALGKLEEFNRLLMREDLMYPADALYRSNWDTIHVNPFEASKIDLPESYTIDCRSFVMPIDNFTRVNSKYGPRRRRMHRGTDLKLEKGDTVRAAFSGKVRIRSYERRGYGYYLVLRHPNGLETVYGHLSKFIVGENEIVKAGQAIALGGNTGRSTGAHLHFETRFLGKDIDPEEIIDFESGTPIRDKFVFTNVKINGKKTNIYTTSNDAVLTHRVKSGETLSHIAVRYGTTVNELCRLNGITRTSRLQIGQGIRVRGAKTGGGEVQGSTGAVQGSKAVQGSTVSGSTVQGSKVSGSAAVSGSGTVTAAAVGAVQSAKTFEVAVTAETPVVYHLIQKGETLYNIANKYNTTVEKLLELNNFEHNTILKPGKKIRCS